MKEQLENYSIEYFEQVREIQEWWIIYRCVYK